MTSLRMVTAFLCTMMHLSSVCRSEEGQAGTILGKVVFPGDHHELTPYYTAGASVKDAEICAASNMPDERLIVDRQTRGVCNVFVWLKRKENRAAKVATPERQLKVPELIFEGCRIRPHAFCVRTETGMRVISRDAVAHNPRDYPLKNSPGCVGLSPVSREGDSGGFIHTFTLAEPQPVRIACDYHPWISAYVLVQDHPWMTVTTSSGDFRIEGVPYGEHEVAVWHELSGFLRKGIAVVLDSPEIRISDTEMKISESVNETLSFQSEDK